MPLRKSSRQVQFINTAHPNDRAFLLKSMDKIVDLPDSSDDTESDNLIKKYQRRPRQLENLCLADFVSLYNCVKEPRENNNLDDSGYLPECFTEESNDDDPYIHLEEETHNSSFRLRGGIKLVRRTKPKIVCSVRFNKCKDPENYFREQLMLYTPWRNENKDIIQNNHCYQERYEKQHPIISHNKLKYEYHAEILEKAFEDLNNLDADEFGNIAPCAQHNDEQDITVGI